MRRKEDWIVDERSDPLERLAADLVGRALDRRWWPMVRTSALAGAITALLVSLPITVVQNESTDSAARQRADANCQLVRGIANVLGSGNSSPNPLLTQGGLISSDARLRLQTRSLLSIPRHDRNRNVALLNDPFVISVLTSNQRASDATARYWLDHLIPALYYVAHADCASYGS